MSASHSPLSPHEPLLYISARSPYARRVRVALIEGGIPFQEKVEDVFHPSSELLEANPLGRVPVIKLISGTTICDSQQILNALTSTRPSCEEARWSGLFVGLCDKIVERYLESLRPTETQDTEIFREFDTIFDRCLSLAESHLQTSLWMTHSEGPTQADFDVAIALTYASLRYSQAWIQRFPACASFVQRMESRPSFQKTHPPSV